MGLNTSTLVELAKASPCGGFGSSDPNGVAYDYDVHVSQPAVNSFPCLMLEKNYKTKLA